MKHIASHWAKELPENHREAMFEALCILTDDFLDSEDLQDTLIASFLPEKYTPRYDKLFFKKFFITFITIGYKLEDRNPPIPLLSCTAEELALHILIKEASVILEERNLEANFESFEDEVFQDLDFELLYELRFDGIEDSPVGDELGMGNLRFDEWFLPFQNAATPIHSYASSND